MKATNRACIFIIFLLSSIIARIHGMKNNLKQHTIYEFFGLTHNMLEQTNDTFLSIKIAIGAHLLNNPWWYITKKFPHPSTVASIALDHSGKRIATGSLDTKIRIFDMNIYTQASCYNPFYAVPTVSFNSSGEYVKAEFNNNKQYFLDSITLANVSRKKQANVACYEQPSPLTVTYDGDTTYILDTKTDRIITTFPTNNNWTTTACLSHNKKRLATISYNNIIRIFTLYNRWTLEQLLLKKIIDIWLLVEKPDKEINSSKLLLTDVAQKFGLKKEELNYTWLTLPRGMQQALWRNINTTIKKYGK